MCYSAQVWADYRMYVRNYGADIDIKTFVRLYIDIAEGSGAKTPKAMDDAFREPRTDDERVIRDAIEAWEAATIAKLEQELFKQAKRLADAQRTLATKQTKKALEDERISSNKIEQIKARLANLKRTEPRDRDSRIFPGMYAPVLVAQAGKLVVKPMRYQCRPAGKPAFYDRKFPGTYNARRDNLEGFWRDLFGHHHALMVAQRFYENVSRHRMEGRELAPGEKEENVVLEFATRDGSDMLIACLWSAWSGKEGELLSFAAITDDPEPEVAAAGHDRTIINLKPDYVEQWLNPDSADLASLYRMFDDKQHPYYEHRKAA